MMSPTAPAVPSARPDRHLPHARHTTRARLFAGLALGAGLVGSGLLGSAASADPLPVPAVPTLTSAPGAAGLTSAVTGTLASVPGVSGLVPSATSPTTALRLPAAPSLPSLPAVPSLPAAPSATSLPSLPSVPAAGTGLTQVLGSVQGALPGAAGSGASSGSPAGGTSAGSAGGTTALPSTLVGACVRLTSAGPPAKVSVVLLDTELVSRLTAAGLPLQQLVVPCPATTGTTTPGTGTTGGTSTIPTRGTASGAGRANSAVPAAFTATPTGARLPHTGDDVLPWVYYGIVLLAGGATLTVAARRGLVPLPSTRR